MNKNRPAEWVYYNCIVTKVVDGDTIDVSICWDVGFNAECSIKARLRLARINAPELRRGTDESKERGKIARDFLEQKILNTYVTIKTSKGDAFGRWIAEVTVPADPMGFEEGEDAVTNISDLMVSQGHADYQNY